MNDTDVQNWARTVDPDSANPAEIERMLLREHPRIVRLIDESVAEASSVVAARQAASSGAGVASMLAALFAVAGLFAPIAGAVLSMPENPVIADLAVPQALLLVAVCFSISVIALVGASVVWMRRGAHRTAVLPALGIVAVIGGAISTALLPNLAADEGVAVTPWNIPGMIAIAVGVLAAGAAIMRRGSASPVVAASARERLRVAVAALPAEERRRMHSARTEALDVLVTRGILQHDAREQRRDMPIGAVAVLDGTLRARQTGSA